MVMAARSELDTAKPASKRSIVFCAWSIEIPFTSHRSSIAHTPNMIPTSALRSGVRTRFESIAKLWPVDPLRTNESVNFGRAITRNLLSSPGDRCLKAAEKDEGVAAYADRSLRALDRLRQGRESIEVGWRPKLWFAHGRDARSVELTCAYIVTSLTLAQQHPLPSSIVRPASDPEYYQRIRRVIEKTAKDGRAPTLSLAQRIRMFFGKKPFESAAQ